MDQPLTPETESPKDQAVAETMPPEDGNISLIREFFLFLRQDRKWWLAPIIILIVVLSLILFIGTCTPLSPFIYSLF